jgi:glycosyltransferase involved in cell wall biosynthesis
VPTVLFVGRMDQEKRVDELIRAFAALPAGLPAELEIVGDGGRRADWTALAAGLGLGDRVRFRGFISEDDLLDAYARAAVFCMPGVAELQSIATLEAMAAGTPIVAADAMALPHLVRPGRNGWLYRPGDVPELTARLTTLLSDADLRRRMGAASREIVAEHAIGATLSTFEGIYERLLGRRSGVQVSRAA